MSSVVTVITVIFSVILTPFLIFFCGIVVLAALGKTLGVRRLYVKLLLRVFEVSDLYFELACININIEILTIHIIQI